MNVSFAGCGFLGLYHVGVASCFKTYAPQLCLYKVSGASAGGIAALGLLADVSLGEMTSNVLRVAAEARARTFGPFSPSFNINEILYEGLNRVLPDDIHLKVQGRLHISLTKVYDGSNILVNQFSNKEEVIQVVLASAFIPIFTGWLPPRYRGIRVIDGGYSDNLPVLDGLTITVSPFSGNADICPQDDTAWKVLQVNVANTSIEVSKENFYRLGNVLLPPDPEVLARVCKQGFEDALRFLQKRYLISCTRCLTVNSNYKIEDEAEYDEEDEDEHGQGKMMNVNDNADRTHEYTMRMMNAHSGTQINKQHDPNCLECKLQREVAKDGSVPESVWSVLEDAIEEEESGITGWIRMIPAAKIIRLLTLPAALPLHIAGRIVNRLVGLLPRLTDDLKVRAAAERLIEQLCAYMTNSGYMVKHEHHHARYTCEFNITQYGEEDDDDYITVPSSQRKESVKDIFSIELTAELESSMKVDLPHTQEEAIRFQNENFAAAVSNSRSQSRVVSRAASRTASRAASRAVSRMGSRASSYNSLYGLEEDSPALEHIRQVTQHQNAVMAFYYTDSLNQVKVTEIFDVTSTDAGLLTDDLSNLNLQGLHPTHSEVSSALNSIQDDSRFRRGSLGRSRHGSGVSESSFVCQRSVNPTPFIASTTIKQPSFRVGDCDYLDDSGEERSSIEQTSRTSSLESSYSDPESDWKQESRLTSSVTM